MIELSPCTKPSVKPEGSGPFHEITKIKLYSLHYLPIKVYLSSTCETLSNAAKYL